LKNFNSLFVHLLKPKLYLMKLFITNQNTSERVVRFIVSLFLLPAPFMYQNNLFAIVQAMVGGILLFNAFSGMCVIYRFFGANTCKI